MKKHFFTTSSPSFDGTPASRVLSGMLRLFLLTTFILSGMASHAQTTIGGVNMGNLPNYLFFFANGSTDANWQGATKGFAGNVAIDGIQASERTSGGVPYAGTIYTNSSTLSAWAAIVDQNDPGQVSPAQAFGSTNQTSLVANLETDLANALTQIKALSPSTGYSGVSSTSLNGLNTQNSVAQTFVINITSGLSVSTKINITGDAGDIFILRWDSDGNPNNGFQGTTKFQSGGAVVPLGGLKASNFINVAGNISSSGGGSNPPAPYPQGPRHNNGTGALIVNGSNFSGGGFFTGYWLTTGDPASGVTSSLSNGIFVGGWYSTTSKFSMTSGTSGVYVAPNVVPPGTTCAPCISVPSIYPECIPPSSGYAADITVNNNTTWDAVLGGFDHQNLTQKIRITGSGILTVTNGNVKLASSSALLVIDGPEFRINNGNLQTEPGARFIFRNGILRTSGNIQQVGGFVCITNSEVEVGDEQAGGTFNTTGNQYTSANFQNDGGKRYLNDVCMNVTHDYQLQSSSGGEDILIDVCAEIGDQGPTHARTGILDGQDSGNFQNSKNMKIYGSEFIVIENVQNQGSGSLLTCDVAFRTINGSFQNSCSLTGCELCIWVDDNHFIQNSGPWSAVLENRRGTVQGSIPNLPPNASVASISGCFTNCCDAAPPLLGSLGDCVWNDQNQNGVKDSGEPGVPNVTVQLKNCSNAVIATQTTNASGIYGFSNLSAGCYRVGVVLPAGFQFSPANQGVNDAVDSDIIPATAMTGDITLDPGENDPTNDAGIFQPIVQTACVGDFVFRDNNGNGIQGLGEPGIAGVFVFLERCDGTSVAFKTTDADGKYLFCDLAPGDYRIRFANPGTFTVSPQNAGTDDCKDSDMDFSGITHCFNLSPGETDLCIDGGFTPPPSPCTITPVVTNILCDGKGTSTTADDTYTFVLTATTTGTGTTWTGGFSHACLGAFLVGPTAYGTPITLGPFPAGEFSCGNTNPPIVYQNGLNIDVSVSDSQNSGCSNNTTVMSPGPCSPAAPASLGNFVWNDTNQNGTQNVGEPGVPGVTVKLYKCDNTFVSQQTTGTNGEYLFTNLAPNMQYYVEFSGLPAGFQFSPKDAAADNIDSDANTANGRTDCTFLSPGEQDLTVDAGIFSPTPQNGSIGDCVWNDQNQNGLKDPGEPGVPNITVKLLNCLGVVLQMTTTNASGIYGFSNLPAGSYIVEFSNLPAGFQFTVKDAGNDSADSDANPGTGRTDCFNLAPGQNDPTRDAGIYQPAVLPGSIGDFVWNDLDKDGIQDSGEPGVQGVVVKLFKCDGTFVTQQTTNANGAYLFTNVAANMSYFVQFSNLPAGFVFSPKDAGLDDSKDSDPDVTTGNTACFNLAPGQTDLTRDAGINQPSGTGPGTVGDFVWFDTNANGIQDPGEPGIPNVFVILETCTGAFVNFATTNAQGQYLITNVPAGQYRVKFASPGTYNGVPIQLTLQNAGTDDAKDSDADWLGFTPCFTLATGQSNLTLDAGFTGEAPPPVCAINGTVSNVVCNNGQVSFTLVVNGSNTGAWGYDIPALNQYMLPYGQPYNFTIPGSATPTVLQLVDHDVAGCTTTVTITSPPPCNSGGGTGSPCDGVTFTGGAGSITVGGLNSPIEIVKIFNSAWLTVFECTANCANPTIASNLPAGTYHVKVQLFSATWQLLCTKEGDVTVSSFNGGGSSQLIVPGDGNEVVPASTGTTHLPAIFDRSAGNATAAASDFSFSVFPNPASGFVKLDIRGGEGKNAVIQITDLTGREVKRLEISELDGSTQEVDLRGMHEGLYFVRLLADGEQPQVRPLRIGSY